MPIIDDQVYMIAEKEAKVIDGYIHLHIKQKPRWMPHKVYRWILYQLLEMTLFKRT